MNQNVFIKTACLWCAVSLAALLSSCASGVPPLQDWFIEHFSIGQVTLPAGVSVEVIPPEPARFPQEYLSITNSSSTYLYLNAIEVPYTAPTGPQFVASTDEVPLHYIPAMRIASNRADVWDVLNYEPPWELGWTPNDRYDSSNALRIYVWGDHLAVDSSAIFTYNILNIEYRNRTDYGDLRPANVTVPDPLVISLPITYDGVDIQLPITISYTVNETYKDVRSDNVSLWLVVGVLVVIAIVGLIAKVVS